MTYQPANWEIVGGEFAHKTDVSSGNQWLLNNVRNCPTSLTRFSATAWFVATSLAAYRMVFETRDPGLVCLNQSGATGQPLTASWNAGGAEYAGATGLDLATNEWTFGAMVVNGSTLTVYRASPSKPLKSFDISITETARNITTGWILNSDGPTGTDWMGYKDDWRFYSRALTAGEVALLAQHRGIAYELARRTIATGPSFRPAWAARCTRIVQPGVSCA